MQCLNTFLYSPSNYSPMKRELMSVILYGHNFESDVLTSQFPSNQSSYSLGCYISVNVDFTEPIVLNNREEKIIIFIQVRRSIRNIVGTVFKLCMCCQMCPCDFWVFRKQRRKSCPMDIHFKTEFFLRQ